MSSMHIQFGWTSLRLWGGGRVLGIVGLLLLALAVPPALAQEEPAVVARVPAERINPDWEDCGIRGLDDNAFVSLRAPFAKRQQASANFVVEYGEGFTAEARRAFERAVAIWETHIASPLPIRIEANFEPRGKEVLGGASSNNIYALDRNRDDELDTILGDALVDAFLGEDQNPRDQGEPTPPDIVATFNKSRNDWYFGAGDAPAGTIDFTSVVLHEIGHGLNYFSLFRHEEGEGTYGIDWDGSGQVDPDERFLGVYGNRVVQRQTDGSSLFLRNRSAFPPSSDELGDALTGNQLFFAGPLAERAAQQSDGPVPPKIYAPVEFDLGSSIDHLDESTYEPASKNALMTPKFKRAETVRRPGPIMCGQLVDMGWTLGPGCAFDPASIDIVSAEPEGGSSNRGRVTLTWQFTGEAPVAGFIVEQKFFDTLQQRKRVNAQGDGEYSTTVENLKPGDHTFRLNYVTSDSVTVQSGEPVTVTVEAQRPEVSVFPNPFRDVAKVSFILPERQRVRVKVFDALGRHVATPFVGERPADDARPVRFNAGRLSELGSGVYFFQVTGKSFTQTAQAIRVR